jgi:hypothetical protein
MHKETAEQELQAVLRACLTISQRARPPARSNERGSFRFQQNGNRSNVFWDTREAEVQRLSLALAVIAITPEHGAERRAPAVADAQHLLKSTSDAVPAH